MSTHPNSATSIREEDANGGLSRRALLILTTAQQAPNRQWTDRRMAIALGFQEMNAVRPRITELIEAGLLVETGTVEDAVTLKTVRTWRAASVKEAAHVIARASEPASTADQPELPGIFG